MCFKIFSQHSFTKPVLTFLGLCPPRLIRERDVFALEIVNDYIVATWTRIESHSSTKCSCFSLGCKQRYCLLHNFCYTQTWPATRSRKVTLKFAHMNLEATYYTLTILSRCPVSDGSGGILYHVHWTAPVLSHWSNVVNSTWPTEGSAWLSRVWQAVHTGSYVDMSIIRECKKTVD